MRALIAFGVLLSLSIPLWLLTHGESKPGMLAAANQGELLKEIGLHLTFSKPATALKVLHLGKELWNDATPGLEINRKVKLPYPKEGVDLEFQFTWPSEGQSALRVDLTDPDGEGHEKTVWAKGQVNEVITFP